MVIQSESH